MAVGIYSKTNSVAKALITLFIKYSFCVFADSNAALRRHLATRWRHYSSILGDCPVQKARADLLAHNLLC